MPFGYCSCFENRNLYVPFVKAHLSYQDDQQFIGQYGHLANDWQPFTIDQVLQEVKTEISRRRQTRNERLSRVRRIAQQYSFLESRLKCLKVDFLATEFISISQKSKSLTRSNFVRYMQQYNAAHPAFRLYQFPVFSSTFCRALLTECANFNKDPNVPKERPNTMNYHGVLLDEMGLQEFFSDLRTNYLNSISKLLFPEWVGNKLDSHRSFTVEYSSDAQKELDWHYDNAEVTLNVSLNDALEYEGGEIYFGGMRHEPFTDSSSCVTMSHRQGYGILHRGQQLHGALGITNGLRHNLILWMRSSQIRSALCPMCDQKPTVTECPPGDYGDGFLVERQQENQSTDANFGICSVL